MAGRCVSLSLVLCFWEEDVNVCVLLWLLLCSCKTKREEDPSRALSVLLKK